MSFFVQLRKDTHAKKSIAIIEVVTCKVPQITLPANSQGVGKQRSLLHGRVGMVGMVCVSDPRNIEPRIIEECTV